MPPQNNKKKAGPGGRDDNKRSSGSPIAKLLKAEARKSSKRNPRKG